MHSSHTLTRGASHLHDATHCARARPVLIHLSTTPARALVVRASNSKQEGDQTWSQIGKAATELLGAVVRKVTTPAPKQPARPSSSNQSTSLPELRLPELPEISFPASSQVPALLGRAVGSLVGMAVSAIGSQLAKSVQDSAAVYEQAAERLRTNAELRSRLGDITVNQPLSSSTSSININGRFSERITLLVPISGSNARGAMAQVMATSDGSKINFVIDVQMPTGETVRVTDTGSSVIGSVIDVEFQVKQ